MIGPFEKDLDKLRRNWNKWLKANKEMLEGLRGKARHDAEAMGTNDVESLMSIQAAQARELGDRTKVTPPNLASLMMLVVEGSKTALLTGDGHAQDILEGLKYHKKLRDGHIHVDVLKVQHHGSENNIDEDFVSHVTADHYIFCGNGEHENPDLDVIDLVIGSRLANVGSRARQPEAQSPFKLWFNSSRSASRKPEAKAHMAEVHNKVEEWEAKCHGRMEAKFLEGDTPSFELNV